MYWQRVSLFQMMSSHYAIWGISIFSSVATNGASHCLHSEMNIIHQIPIYGKVGFSLHGKSRLYILFGENLKLLKFNWLCILLPYLCV